MTFTPGDRLRAAMQVAAETRALIPRLLETFEGIEDRLWDRAMRPAEVLLSRSKRRLAWNGEFFVVSIERKGNQGKERWARLTIDCADEHDVLGEAAHSLRALIAAGGIVLIERGGS